MAMTLLVLSSLLMLLASSAAPASPGRIVYGADADPHAFPWMLSLHIYGNHACGAVLVTPGFAITAAHCTFGGEFSVLCGAHNVLEDENFRQELDVVQFRRHKDYNEQTVYPSFPNDIAVLKLATNATINDNCQLARMPSPDKDYANLNGIITGWGRMWGTDTTTPDALQWASLTVLDHSRCDEFLGQMVQPDFHICVKDENAPSYVSACKGDSGGPLFADNYTVVGLASWVIGSCGANYPSVYVRVSTYLDWIEETIADMS